LKKQNKIKKLPVLALVRDVCVLETFAIRVHGCLFTLSAGHLPGGRSAVQKSSESIRETSCVMNNQHAGKATSQGAPITTMEFIALIIITDVI
jgi:hypothetical protein